MTELEKPNSSPLRQAAYRARQKRYVTELEEEIAELKSQQKDHPLAAEIAQARSKGIVVSFTQGIVLTPDDDSEVDFLRFIYILHGQKQFKNL